MKSDERGGSPALCSTPSNPCSLRSPVVCRELGGQVLQVALKSPICAFKLSSLHCPVSMASLWWSAESDRRISLSQLIPSQTCLWTEYLCPCIAGVCYGAAKRVLLKLLGATSLCSLQIGHLLLFSKGNSSKALKFAVNSIAEALLSFFLEACPQLAVLCGPEHCEMSRGVYYF